MKHHQHWQKWRSLKAWLEYLQGRRVKRQRNGEQEVLGLRDRGLGHSFHCPSRGANVLRRDVTILCHTFWKKEIEDKNTSSLIDPEVFPSGLFFYAYILFSRTYLIML